MSFCQNCGLQIQEKSKFCANCGIKIELQSVEELKTVNQSKVLPAQKSTWRILGKESIIWGLILVETIAVIGALPLYEDRNISNPNYTGPIPLHIHKYSFWEKSWPMSVAFLVIVIGITLYITWNKPRSVRVIAVLLVAGLLILTAASIMSLTSVNT